MYQLSDIRVIRGERTILHVPSLSIPTTGLTVILGHNGSGKSTLAGVIGGLTRPETGSVTLNGSDLFGMKERARAREVAFLPQKLPNSAGLSCRELVRLGRFPWRGLIGRYKPEDERVIDEAMKETGTDRFAARFADELSGGERQRVWISMLIAQAAPVMILDEPTSALDVQHQYGVLDLLSRLAKRPGCGVITIIHDINLALRFADHVVAMKGGRLLFDGGIETLHSEANLQALFGTRVQLIDHPNPPQGTENLKLAVVCA